MSDPTTLSPSGDTDEIPQWSVRRADVGDLHEVARALTELLVELSGAAPAASELEAATSEVIDDPGRGCLLVAATAEGELVGVLAASWQHAIHVPGRYCILQDLWTSPSWRDRGVGAALVTELLEVMRGQQVNRVEVGLPSRNFAGLEATEAFYRAIGFVSLGPRMRQVLR
jgi:GNAT superfamily N-acetyltransferase